MIRKHNISNRLTLRIFVITSLLFITVCALTYGFISYFMPITYSSQLNSTLDQQVQSFVKELQQKTFEESLPLMDDFTAKTDARLTLSDSYQNLYYETDLSDSSAVDLEEADPSDSSVTDSDETAPSSLSEYDITSVHVATELSRTQAETADIQLTQSYSVQFKDQEEPYFLSVSGSMQAINQAVAAMDQILPLLAIAILFLSLLVSFFYSRYITRPIVKLSRISSSMSQLDFDWQCDERRKDEIGLLAHNLNQMSLSLSQALSRLKKANQSLKDDISKERELEKQRVAFFSAVSHELKTPITIIKGQLEGMRGNIGVYKDRDKYLSRSFEVACSLENMVEEILTISRMENTSFVLKRETFDFSQMLTQQLQSFHELIEVYALEIHAQIPEGITCSGDWKLLQKVTSNLIQNAIKYTPSGNPIYIKIQAESAGVRFAIENIGNHISEKDLPQIMEAFYRVDQSRNRNTGGSGLGLYIVKMIMDLHQAQYRIENTTAGVQFTFLLPDLPPN